MPFLLLRSLTTVEKWHSASIKWQNEIKRQANKSLPLSKLRHYSASGFKRVPKAQWDAKRASGQTNGKPLTLKVANGLGQTLTLIPPLIKLLTIFQFPAISNWSCLLLSLPLYPTVLFSNFHLTCQVPFSSQRLISKWNGALVVDESFLLSSKRKVETGAFLPVSQSSQGQIVEFSTYSILVGVCTRCHAQIGNPLLMTLPLHW